MNSSPETQLFGYESERQQIDEVIASGCRMIVLQGPAGVGKTMVARHVVSDLRKQRWLLGWGKHGEGVTGAEALLQAVRALVEAALEELYEPEAGLAQLRFAMGLFAPVFDQVWQGKSQRDSLSIDGRVIAESLGQVLELILGWVAGFGLPLVLTIDDWDRASPDVCALYLRMSRLELKVKILVIVTGRTWSSVSTGNSPHQLKLQLLGLNSTARADLLSGVLGAEFGDIINQQIPAYVTSPLDLIQRARAVALQLASGKSVAAPETLAAALQDDLKGFINNHVSLLPQVSRNVMALAAIIGDDVELAVLQTATGLEPIVLEQAIEHLANTKLISRFEKSIRFSHDTIRSAIAETISRANVDALISAAASRLLSACDQELGYQQALEALVLASPPKVADAMWVAPLLTGARMALALLDAAKAKQLASLALTMDGGTEKAQQETVKLCAITSLANGALELTSEYAAKLRALAQTRSDISFAFAISASAARASGNGRDALDWSLRGHKLLGWQFPSKPSPLATISSIFWTNLVGEFVRALPFEKRSTDMEMLALSSTTATIFFEFSTPHVVALATRSALSPKTRNSGAGLSGAAFVASLMGRHRLASRLGEKVFKDRLPHEPNWPSTAYRAHFFGRMWTNATRSFDSVHKDLYSSALAEGNIEIATWVLRNQAGLFWRHGGNLAELERLAEVARVSALRIGDQTNAIASDQMWLVARQLQGLPAEPNIEIDPKGPLALESAPLTWLAYQNLCGKFDKSIEIVLLIPRKLPVSLTTHPGEREFRFHRAVAMLVSQRRFWPEDVKCIARGAKLNPLDNSGRILILRALVANTRGQPDKAYRLVVDATHSCAELDRQHELSLAHFLAADFATVSGKPDAATDHLAKAKRAWMKWGADPSSHETLCHHLAQPDEQTVSALILRLEKSERESRAKSRLLAMVGHELRTPLQAISGAVELIQGTTNNSENLGIVTASIDRLSTMIDDLSDMTALEVGELAINPRAFNLSAFLRNLIDTHTEPLKAAGLEFCLDAPKDLNFWLFGDDKRLQQILDNLLNNARKYGAGSVVLHVFHTRDQWTFEVTDAGEGLSPEQAVRVFEPFVRGPSQGVVQGHGIGLRLARNLAENMKGQLVLLPSTLRQKGTRFALTLPLPDAELQETQTLKSAFGPKHILLIEDEPLSRDVLERLLSLDDHHVTAFSSGQAAVDALAGKAGGMDFAFIDFNMPGLNGLETAQLLRNMPSGKSLKTVLITAQMKDELIHAQQSGLIEHVVQKPVNLEAIRRLLGSANRENMRPASSKLDPEVIDQLGQYCAALNTYLPVSDWQGLSIAAHKLAGAALVHGQSDLGEMALELEGLSIAKDQSASEIMVTKVQEIYERIRANG